jgi:HupE / UreJ protein
VIGRGAMAVAVAAVIVLSGARTAGAHPLDLGYLRVDVDADGAGATITLDLEAGLAARLGDAEREAPLASDAGACAWDARSAVRRGTTVTVIDHARCAAPIRALRWSLPLVGRASPRFQLLARVRGLGGDRVAVIDAAHPVLSVAAAGAAGELFDFVRTGIAHIGAAPSEWRGPRGWKLPDGIDHILFVLALLLAGGTLRQLAGVITGFTVGHSITLALATLGVARPPPSLVEPLIALSIAVVAAEAFAGTRGRHRWTIAALFGLVHGFGFAGALRQLDLDAAGTAQALIGFNLGVELGQMAIIAVAAPLVMLARRDPRGRVVVARVVPAIIFVCGVYWFVARLIG